MTSNLEVVGQPTGHCTFVQAHLGRFPQEWEVSSGPRIPGHSGLMLEQLRNIARNRHGVLLTSDLEVLGLDHNARQAVTRGLYRIARGAFCVDKPSSPSHWHFLRTVAALTARNEQVIASHVSAAVAHELPTWGTDLDLVHLTSAKTSRVARAGVVVHRAEAPRVEARGIPVTDVARTIVDCARSCPRDSSVAMADYALHKALTTREQLEAAVSGAKGRGVSRARAVVALADGRSESVAETRTRLICVDAGIDVTPQVWLRDADGVAFARVDLLVDGVPVVIEFDGKEKYEWIEEEPVDSAAKHWQEKVRRERIEDLGYVVVNIYWSMLDNPAAVVAKIRRAILRADRSSPLVA